MSIASPMEMMCFPAFQRAAAAVATFELRVRLLADRDDQGTPLQRNAIAGELTPLIGQLCAHYNATEEETQYLKSCAGIRNKLFHLELSRVTGRIRPLSEQLNEGRVWMIDLANEETHRVSTTATGTGRIFGWMLESFSSGAFDAVVSAMNKATEIVNSLRDKAYEHLPEGATDDKPSTSG